MSIVGWNHHPHVTPFQRAKLAACVGWPSNTAFLCARRRAAAPSCCPSPSEAGGRCNQVRSPTYQGALTVKMRSLPRASSAHSRKRPCRNYGVRRSPLDPIARTQYGKAQPTSPLTRVCTRAESRATKAATCPANCRTRCASLPSITDPERLLRFDTGWGDCRLSCAELKRAARLCNQRRSGRLALAPWADTNG